MNAKEQWRLRTQAKTRKLAVHNGEKYTSTEDRVICAGIRSGKTNEQIALETGRTTEAIAQYRYRYDLKRKQLEPEKLPPTRFSYYYDSQITNISFNHSGDALAVFYPAGTPDLVLERAFESEGYDRALFVRWQQEREWNHV